MSQSQEPLLDAWHWREAFTPLFFTVAFIFSGLVALSFPLHSHTTSSVIWTTLLVMLAIATSNELFPDGFVTVVYWRFCFIYLAHISFLLYSGKSESNVHGIPDAQRWRRGYKLLFNPRGIRTNWESRDTIAITTSHESPSERNTRRLPAMCKRIAVLCFEVVLMSFYQEFSNPIMNSFIRPTTADFTPEKVNIIRRSLLVLCNRSTDLTIATITREWIIRLWHMIDEHVSELFWLTAYHDAFAIFFSGVLGLDSLEEWPPIFGSITHAATMRGFWAHFWHRLIYQSFSYHAGILCTRVARLRDRTAVRYASNLTVFLMSGLMHAFVDWRRGAKCALQTNMWYWSIQPLAFVLEDAVQYVWTRFVRPKPVTKTGQVILRGIERCVGYAWVLVWLSWSYPKRRFQIIANCKL